VRTPGVPGEFGDRAQVAGEVGRLHYVGVAFAARAGGR
jgi:hypothetical protein